MRAIDTCSYVFPTKEILRYMIKSWGIYDGYLNIFAKNIMKTLGYPREEYEKARNSMDKREFIDYLANTISEFALPLDAFIEILDDANVEKAIHINDDVESTTGVKPISNEYIASIVREYPDKLMAFAGVDPHKGEKAVAEAEKALTTLELDGIAIYPFRHILYANDSLYYPIYELAIKYDVPVWIHTSNNWHYGISYDYGHPKYLDDVAVKYPDLKIIAGHAGWPWINDMISVAWRHRNIYIEISAFRPKYIKEKGSGFEMLLYYGDRVLRDKIVWGSTWLLLGMVHKQIIEEMKELPVRSESLENWLYHNAKKLLKI